MPNDYEKTRQVVPEELLYMTASFHLLVFTFAVAKIETVAYPLF